MFSVSSSGIICSTIRFLSSIHDESQSPQPLTLVTNPGCLIIVNSNGGLENLIIHIVFEFVVLVLLVYRVLGHFSNLKHPGSIIDTLYRDGIGYFAFIIVTSTIIVFLVIHLGESQPSSNLLLVLQSILHSITCNRLLLRLRSVHSHRDEDVDYSFTRTKVQVTCPERIRWNTSLNTAGCEPRWRWYTVSRIWRAGTHFLFTQKWCMELHVLQWT